MQTLLLVEDDKALGAQVAQNLRGAGFQVDWDQDGDEALRRNPDDYHLILLDLMLPGSYGLDILKRIRTSSDVPVLILSARDETQDKVRGFALGADDYVTKPFWPEELLARVTARLRRPTLHRGSTLQDGALLLRTDSKEAQLDDAALDLTPTEFEILASLLRRPGQAVSRTALRDAALDPDRPGTERTLDTHVSRLRKKLGDAGTRIQTVWGIGYRYQKEAP